MRYILHLTNGSAITEKVAGCGADGTIVPWNDVLHEGPVPPGLGTAALRDVRVDFLAASGAGPRGDLARGFAERDQALDDAISGAKRIDEIVLWFEHDLFDQLHLVQILDRLPVDGGPLVTAVQPLTYLGHYDAEAYPALFAGRVAVTSAARLSARDAWQAFRSSDPRAVAEAIPRVAALPHLGPALHRHLEQFPSTANGLSRTEQATVEVVAGGATEMREIFVRTQDREEAFFMGDFVFFSHVAPLFDRNRPLLTRLARGVKLTADGERVLAGNVDHVSMNGIDRWLGGVQLSGCGPVWRWDAGHRALRFV